MAGWNGFAGLIWPAGRGVENPDINYEEEWWQHTPLSESNTNTERLWFVSVDMDTICWARIQLLDCQQEAPVNTVFPQHPPKLFTRNPTIYFFATKTALDIIQLWFNYFRDILAYTLPERLCKELPRQLFIHSCLLFCLWGWWGWLICQSFGALIKRHAAWHTQPNHPAFWDPQIHYQTFRN